jgi:hypothetical protein
MKMQEDLVADKDKRFRLLQEKKNVRPPLPPTPKSDVSKEESPPPMKSIQPTKMEVAENHSKGGEIDTTASKYHHDIAGLMADLDAESDGDDDDFRASILRNQSRPTTEMSMSGMSLVGEERLDLDFSGFAGEDEKEGDSDLDSASDEDDTEDEHVQRVPWR